jgi:hypothetical protein
VAAGAVTAQAILICRPIESGSVPAPPGPLVADTAFELATSPGVGQTLPAPIALTVTFPPSAVPADQRERLVLAYLNGTTWTPLPDQDAEPDETQISASVDRAGIYGLYRQP